MLISGCGPLISSYTIVSAQLKLNEGQDLQCQEKATFEFTSAQSYLDEAKAKQIKSEFSDAIEYAQKSEEFSKKCLEKNNQYKSSPKAIEKTK